MKRRTWKARLSSFAEHVQMMYRDIAQMPQKDLLALRKACKRVTQTNCGWSTYQAAKIIEPDIEAEIRRRKLAKKDQRIVAAHIAKGNHVRKRVPGCECAGCVRLGKLS